MLEGINMKKELNKKIEIAFLDLEKQLMKHVDYGSSEWQKIKDVLFQYESALHNLHRYELSCAKGYYK